MAFSKPVRNSEGSTESPKTLIVPFAMLATSSTPEPKLDDVSDFLSRRTGVREDLISVMCIWNGDLLEEILVRDVPTVFRHSERQELLLGDWVDKLFSTDAELLPTTVLEDLFGMMSLDSDSSHVRERFHQVFSIS